MALGHVKTKDPGQLALAGISGFVGRVDWQSNNSVKKRTHEPMFMCSSKVNVVGSVDSSSNNPSLLPPTLSELKRLAAASKSARAVPEPTEDRRVTNRALRRRLAPGTVDEIVKRYVDGESSPKLCIEYGVSRNGLLKLLRDRGVQIRQQPVPDEVIAQAADLYEGGMSLAGVSKRVGVPPNTVRNMLIAHGVTMRPRGGAYNAMFERTPVLP